MIQTLNPFRTPSADEIAAKQLEATKRDLLAAEAAVEQAIAVRDMLKLRAARLQAANGTTQH